jgi:hypothetical protein
LSVVGCRLSVVGCQGRKGNGWSFFDVAREKLLRVRNSAFSQGTGLQFKILHAGYPVAFQILPDTTEN